MNVTLYFSILSWLTASRTMQYYAAMKPKNAEATAPLVPYQTKREAAEFLGVSVWTIDRYVKARKLPHFKLNGHLVRFRMSDLVQFIERAKVT